MLRMRVQSRPFGTAPFAPAPSSDNTLLRDALRRNMPKLQEAFTQIDAKQASSHGGRRMLAGACWPVHVAWALYAAPLCGSSVNELRRMCTRAHTSWFCGCAYICAVCLSSPRVNSYPQDGMVTVDGFRRILGLELGLSTGDIQVGGVILTPRPAPL